MAIDSERHRKGLTRKPGGINYHRSSTSVEINSKKFSRSLLIVLHINFIENLLQLLFAEHSSFQHQVLNPGIS